MGFRVVVAGTKTRVPFQVIVATAIESIEVLDLAVQVCADAAVFDAQAQPIDDAELALLAEQEQAQSPVAPSSPLE